MRKHLTFISFFFCCVFFFSCGLKKDREDAEKISLQFYDALKANNIDQAMHYWSGSEDDSRLMRKILEDHLSVYGNLKSVTPLGGFDVSTEGAGASRMSTVKLAYHTEYEFGKTRDSLTLIKSGDSLFYITFYKYREEESAMAKQIASAREISAGYLDKIQKGNYEEALSYCGYSAFDSTSQTAWTETLSARSMQTGTMSNYSIDGDATQYFTPSDENDHGKYYTVHAESNCPTGNLTETITLYAPSYTSDVKIVSHHWSSDDPR